MPQMEEWFYDEMFQHAQRHWWYRGRRKIMFSQLDRWHGRATGRVLDLGCGAGPNLVPLSRYGEVWGADVFPRALDFCRTHFSGRLDVVRLPDAPYDDATFDLIVMFDVLEHVEDDAAALRTVRRILKPGGTLALTVPALRWLWSPMDVELGHFRRYQRPDLRQRLLEADFGVRKLTYFNSFLLPAMAFGRLLLRSGGAGSDLAPGAKPWMRPLEWVFAAERLPLRFLSFPAGGSLLAICRKPER